MASGKAQLATKVAQIVVKGAQKQAIISQKFGGSSVGFITRADIGLPPSQRAAEIAAAARRTETGTLAPPNGHTGPEAVCDLISNPIAKAACLLLLPGGDGPAIPGTDVAVIPPTTGCAIGTVPDGFGGCRRLTGSTPRTPTPMGPGGNVGGAAVVGSFGLPATQPAGRSRLIRSCGPRMVLGIDNLCYPKAVLPPRSKFRKWRRPPKPVISRRDTNAIRIAAGARDRVKELAQDVGFKVSTHTHKRKK